MRYMTKNEIVTKIETYIQKGKSDDFRDFITELKAVRKLELLEDDVRKDFTPLCWAVNAGQVEKLFIMIKNQRPSLFNPNFERDASTFLFPLYIAIRARNITLTEYLGRAFDFDLKCKVPKPTEGKLKYSSAENRFFFKNFRVFLFF